MISRLSTSHFHLKSRKVLFLLTAMTLLAGTFFVGLTQETMANREPVQLVIDTEPGVDDATAVAWLLSQDKFPVEILGITTTAGNATNDNATNNVLLLLEAAGRTDIPVVRGASAPLVKSLSSTPSMLHGPDGLWFVGMSNPQDTSGVPTNTAEFYRDTAVANPGAKLVALGPLTNIANAVQAYPDEMALYSEVIILGGAYREGNTTPVAEYNIWQDPEAADIVLNSGLPITLIPIDAFDDFAISMDDIQEIADDGTPVAQLVAQPLQTYANVQTQGSGADAKVPDVTAVMYAVRSQFARTVEPALVKVVTDDTQARGLTVMGFTFNERIVMIADDAELSALVDQVWVDPDFNLEAALFAIYLREPENADVMLQLRGPSMQRLFMQGMTE